jgi:ubiquinone/menaquinone biosynthesis C-methylase UbiE
MEIILRVITTELNHFYTIFELNTEDEIMENGIRHCDQKHRRGEAHGPDSFWMHDPQLVFDQLGLKSGDVFVDLGCGTGRYALAAAKIVGKHGRVYAVDRLSDCIDALTQEAKAEGVSQLQAVGADITARLPLDSESCDSCFICTVLHSLNLQQCAENLFKETHRILKQGGKLFIIECKKTDTPFGPPAASRISPEELDGFLCSYGFSRTGLTDLGYNYMVEYIEV